MSVPQARITQVGVQEIKIYPWNGSTGPYDSSTEEQFFGLQNFDVSMSSTDAQGYGGETVFEIFSAEVRRETEIKFSAFDLTLRALQIALGGSVGVDPSNGNGKEVQTYSAAYGDRAPFFRAVVRSTVGNGNLFITFPKLRVTGSVTWNMKMDAIHIPEFSARALFDKTYSRVDGVPGGAPYDYFYGDGSQTTPHS